MHVNPQVAQHSFTAKSCSNLLVEWSCLPPHLDECCANNQGTGCIFHDFTSYAIIWYSIGKTLKVLGGTDNAVIMAQNK